MTDLHVTALTKHKQEPAARFRVRQHIPNLLDNGVQLTELTNPFAGYPPQSLLTRPFWFAASSAAALTMALRSRRADVVLLQRELISTLPTFESFAGSPRVLDVDDAIWLHRNGLAADKIAGWCDALICGNEFVADYFSQFKKPIKVLRTAVDTQRYSCADATRDPNRGRKYIGWSGNQSGFPDLKRVEAPLKEVLDRFPDWDLLVMADTPPEMSMIPPHRLRFEEWSEAREIEVLSKMDVGIMPLRDSDWSRGKCGFKLLLYLSMGIPAIASPIGMNQDVLRTLGYPCAARRPEEWVAVLTKHLASSDADRGACGKVGREFAIRNFDLSLASRELADYLKEVHATFTRRPNV